MTVPKAPEAISSASARIDGISRKWWPTPMTTPARWQASSMAAASALLSANGFSQ